MINAVLLPLHTLTGCDSTSYPYGKGNMTAINLLRKQDLQFLHVLGDLNATTDDILQTSHRLFGLLYGSSNPQVSLSKLRYNIYSGRKDTPKIKSLPPTDEAAKQHFLRAHLQMSLWESGDLKGPPDINIETFGWKVVDGIPEPAVGVAVMAPPELMKIVACGCSADAACSRRNCNCYSDGLSCTSSCKCSAESQCNNPHTKYTDSEIITDEHDDALTTSDEDE